MTQYFKGAGIMAIISKTLLRASLLVATGSGLSGCVYDVGLGFASDGYYDDGYGCDPYGGYDAYYDCDYGQGFGNIGFGGGYYDNYYYPGYGVFLFDNVGRRYPMRDQHRRYWGEKRHSWYREHRGGNREGGRYDGRDRGFRNDATPGMRDWPNQRAGRARDDQDDRRAVRREERGGTFRTGQNPNEIERAGSQRGRGDGYSRRDRQGNNASNEAILPAQRAQQNNRVQTSAPMPGAAPAPRPNPSPLRRDRNEGDNVRDQ